MCGVVNIDCAEIVNTITNVMFMLLGWRGIVDCFREGHDKVFVVAFLGYAFVGLGSSFYHTTLWCMLCPRLFLPCGAGVDSRGRFDAASGRAEYDLHDMFDVLGYASLPPVARVFEGYISAI